MIKNHYETLGLTRFATDREIKEAYRKLTSKRGRNQYECGETKFKKIAEAYDVLSDYTKKKEYDKRWKDNAGEDRSEEVMNMFKTLFGGDNPFDTGMFEMPRIGEARVDPPVFVDVQVSLEEVLKGTTKMMKSTKTIIENNNPRLENKTFEIIIKPGCESETTFIFPKEGNQHPGRVPADIVFVVKDLPHLKFEREGADIKYVVEISAESALRGVDLCVPTLDGPDHHIYSATAIKPKTQRRLTGKGLPLVNYPKLRGDLIVEFDVQLPKLSKSPPKVDRKTPTEAEPSKIVKKESPKKVTSPPSTREYQICCKFFGCILMFLLFSFAFSGRQYLTNFLLVVFFIVSINWFSKIAGERRS